jgi:hypothetical protein
MKSHYIIALAAVLSFGTVLCSCGGGGIDKNEKTSLKESADSDNSYAESVDGSNSKSSDAYEEISVNPEIGYICSDLNSVNIYYERISDREIRTLDGKLKGSFTYEINESENEIIFTTTFENLSYECICADFRPNISFISDKIDNSDPIVTADFDGHTIEAGDSYTFSTNVGTGEYSEIMLNYVFSIQVDSASSEYGNGMNVNYVPLGSVFPFIIYLSK